MQTLGAFNEITSSVVEDDGKKSTFSLVICELATVLELTKHVVSLGLSLGIAIFGSYAVKYILKIKLFYYY